MSDEPLPQSEIILYQTEDGGTRVQVRLQDETVWLTQQQMAELFQRERSVITKHIRNIFEEGELVEEAVCANYARTAADGKTYQTAAYNLDVIISVGYRVKSQRGTQFRIWATQRLREYIVKGFLLDDERLKNPDQPFDYFDELMQRIQDIRTSERRFYQKITDIYATSIDYDPTQEVSLLFFKTVQNKVHWAITGQTAAEIVHGRVDAAKPNLGLTNWRGAVIRKQDVAIAKNYLCEPELAALNNLVEQYLIFAQGQALRRVAMHMADWIEKLNGFLTLNDRDILTHAGRISHEMAQAKAELEYDKFKALTASAPRPVDTDFEQATKDLKKLPKPKKPKPPKK